MTRPALHDHPVGRSDGHHPFCGPTADVHRTLTAAAEFNLRDRSHAEALHAALAGAGLTDTDISDLIVADCRRAKRATVRAWLWSLEAGNGFESPAVADTLTDGPTSG